MLTEKQKKEIKELFEMGDDLGLQKLNEVLPSNSKEWDYCFFIEQLNQVIFNNEDYYSDEQLWLDMENFYYDSKIKLLKQLDIYKLFEEEK